jgi:hypothetical protein
MAGAGKLICPNCGAENPKSLIVTTCLRCHRSLQVPSAGRDTPASSPPPAELLQETPAPSPVPPPPVPALPPVLPPTHQPTRTEEPFASPGPQPVPYEAGRAPASGEPAFGPDAPWTEEPPYRRVLTLVGLGVAVLVAGLLLKQITSSPPRRPAPMPSGQGWALPPGMPTGPWGPGRPPLGMPAGAQKALRQALTRKASAGRPPPGRTTTVSLRGARLQLSHLRYTLSDSLPPEVMRFRESMGQPPGSMPSVLELPPPPPGPFVTLEFTAHNLAKIGVAFAPPDLLLRDDRGAWHAPVHTSWAGGAVVNHRTLVGGGVVSVSVCFPIGGGRSPTTVGLDGRDPTRRVMLHYQSKLYALDFLRGDGQIVLNRTSSGLLQLGGSAGRGGPQPEFRNGQPFLGTVSLLDWVAQHKPWPAGARPVILTTLTPRDRATAAR